MVHRGGQQSFFAVVAVRDAGLEIAFADLLGNPRDFAQRPAEPGREHPAEPHQDEHRQTEREKHRTVRRKIGKTRIRTVRGIGYVIGSD